MVFLLKMTIFSSYVTNFQRVYLRYSNTDGTLPTGWIYKDTIIGAFLNHKKKLV